MNFFTILFNDLKRLIKYNKLTFIIVSVSMMFVTFGVFFYAGYIAWGYEDVESEIYFDVYLDKHVSKESIKNLVEKLQNDKIIQMSVAESKEDVDAEDKHTVIGEYSKSQISFRTAGKPFGLNDNEDGVIIYIDDIDNSLIDNKTVVGNVIKIDGKEFPIREVIGTIDYRPPSTCVNYYINNFNTQYIRLIYDNKNIKKNIINILDNNKIVEKYDIQKNKPVILTIDFWYTFSQILLMFCIIIINSFMISYWIKQQQKVYNIYKICGASDRIVRWLEICKMFCIFAISSIFALVIFFIMKPSMVKKELIADLNVFYVEICIVVLFILIIFTYIAVRKEHKKSIIYYVKE